MVGQNENPNSSQQSGPEVSLHHMKRHRNEYEILHCNSQLEPHQYETEGRQNLS